MSWLDGFADEATIKNQSDALKFESAPPELPLFQGSGNAILQGFDIGAVKLAAGLHEPRTPPRGSKFPDQAAVDARMKAHDENVARTIKILTPDPETTGKGAQILSSLFDVLPRAAAGGVIAGPAGAGFMAGAPEYEASKAVGMYNEKLDENTASKKAAINAGVLGVGAMLPGSFGFKSLAADAAATVGANVGLGIVSRGATSKLLADAGYAAQAEQYKAFDKIAMMVDGVLGSAFFGVARLSKTAPELVDAALVENQNNHLVSDSAPGAPVDAKSGNLHQKTLEQSIEQLINDKPVSVKTNIEEATFIRPDANPPIVSKGAMAHFDTVQQVAKENGLNPNIMLAQIDAESGGNVNAKSPAGAEGVAQFMPATALQYGVDVKDAGSSIKGQGRYMADLLKMFGGDYKKALAGYNVGQGNVQKAVKQFGDRWLENLHLITSPKNARETRNYVNKIMAKARTGTEAGDKLAIRMVDEPSQLRQEYAKLEGTDGGRIFSTDLGRELSDGYREDRSTSADVHEQASQFIKDLYAEKLAQPTPADKLPYVFFTAGGTGAGKTSSLSIPGMKETQNAAEIVYDTNMNKLGSSVTKIEQALDANRSVIIQYTYRDPIESLVQGAFPRAMTKGRTVPLEAHADTHIGASKTIRQLQQKYQNDERVKFVFTDNSFGKGNSKLSTLDNLPQVTDNGLLERLQNATETEYQAGRISEKVYEGTTGGTQKSANGQGIRSDSPQNRSGISSEPQSQRTSAEVSPLIQPINIDEGLTGLPSKAFTERGNSVDTQYAIIDAESLVTSHDNNLSLNQNYPHDLQPRDRTRDASEAQISRIENNLNPELLAESPKVSDGAPIIGSDGVVESGNARTIAVRRAYQAGKAEHYREWLSQNAERFGVDKEALAAVKNPVLVRVRSDGSKVMSDEINPNITPKIGESFIVYRVGSADETNLINRNAGNANSVANHIANMQDFEKPHQMGFDKSDTIHAYKVTVNKDFGEYKKTAQGEAVGDTVGRAGGKSGVTYSFGNKNYEAEHVGSVKVNDVQDNYLDKNNFDYVGTIAGAKGIRDAFQNVLNTGAEKSTFNRAEFARQANESAVSALSLTELAKSDASRTSSLDGMIANEDGSINFNASSMFVRRFMQEAVAPTEQNAMMASDGRLSQQGEMRIRNAVFSKAYGDSELVAKMTESTDANIKNILNGMLRAAPAVARLREMISEGSRYAMDIAPDLVKAVRQFSEMRKNGNSVEQYLAQQNMFDIGMTPALENLLIGLQENAKAPKRIADMINGFVQAVDNLGDPRQLGIFDNLPQPKSYDLIADSVETLRKEQGGQASGDLFNSPELASAKQVAELDPNMKITLDDDSEITAIEAMKLINEDLQQADVDSKAFSAAVTCLMRTQ